jgi:hypothetical protein
MNDEISLDKAKKMIRYLGQIFLYNLLFWMIYIMEQMVWLIAFLKVVMGSICFAVWDKENVHRYKVIYELCNEKIKSRIHFFVTKVRSIYVLFREVSGYRKRQQSLAGGLNLRTIYL